MKEAPRGFCLDRLAEVLAKHWKIRVGELEYLTVGFGAHHWRACDVRGATYFLALHDLGADGNLGFDSLSRSLQTAYWLQNERGLDFVLASLPNLGGTAVLRYGQAEGLAVYPWTACHSARALDAPDVGRLLVQLHASTAGMPADLTRTEDFGIPWRAELETALGEVDRAWDAGPYADMARERLREAARPTRALLGRYDRLAADAGSSRSEWVVTHGEPYGPNLVEAEDGRLLLVDWDSALSAPRERDLWEVPPDGAAFPTYVQLAGVSPQPTRLCLYRAWYHLAETAIYVHQFRQPHTGDLNDAEAWANFLFHLPSYANWPELG